MKHLIIVFVLVAGMSSSCVAQSAVTFALNYDSNRIAQLQAAGLPLPPFPHVDIFIADNLSNNAVKYEATVSYLDANGKLQTAVEYCKAAKIPYDNAGDTVTYCSVPVNAVNGAQITIQAFTAQTAPTAISVLP